MKYFIILYIFFFVGCTYKKNDRQSNSDTIFVSGQTTLVTHIDTIELLWSPTAKVRCPQIKTINSPKKCYALELKMLSRRRLKKIRGIEIKKIFFKCVYLYDKDSIINVKYIKEYKASVNFKLLEEIKDEYKNIRIDYRDRKIFYETMCCLESYYGQADLYSTSEKGNPINRELANFVIWNLKNQIITLKDVPTLTCIYPPNGKRQIQIILTRK